MGVADSLTVLVAEDDPAVLKYLRQVLEGHGFRVLAARDGAEALHLARAFEGKIDLICTDVVMPRMNGVQLSEALTAEGRSPRVLYLTGYPEVVLAGLAPAGTRHRLLHKPFTRQQLFERIGAALEDSPDAPRAEPARSRTALVVSAEAGFRHFLAQNLRTDGWTVLEADSGIKALAARAGGRETLLLLIADLDSPGVDGRQLFDLLSVVHPGLRVAYVSSRRDQAPPVVKNADVAFLQRPFDGATLVRCVRGLFSNEPEA